MDNITMRVDGNKLVIEIDITRKLGLSKSSKSYGVASTYGFVPVPNHPNMRININAIIPARNVS